MLHVTDHGPNQPFDRWSQYKSVRLRTRELRAAILDLDLAFSNGLPRCSPDCYRAHSAFVPLVPIAITPTEASVANRWVPATEVNGEVYLAVGLADRMGTGFTLAARTRMRHAARESTTAAYFQGQTEHLYQALEGPMAGTWVIAVREAEYGPVDLLMAAWMIVAGHPPTIDPALGPRLLEAVGSLYSAAIELERVTPRALSELSDDARLNQGRPVLVQEIVDSLLDEEPGRATLSSILGVEEVLPPMLPLREGDVDGEASLIRAVFGVKPSSTAAKRAWSRHPTHPCSAFRRDGNPCGGRAIGGYTPRCHYHAKTAPET